MEKLLSASKSKALFAKAQTAYVHSVSPWSEFPVGAALLCSDGEVFTGCNIESQTLLQGLCAERVALVKALSEGKRQFTHLAVATARRSNVWPCGLCRQMLLEFAPGLIVVVENEKGAIIQRPLNELLPEAFLKP